MHPVISIALIIILLIFIIILGSLLRQSFLLQNKGLPPYINTYPRQRYLFREKLDLPKESSILDLGCGDGTMLRLFVKQFQCKRAVGYDINRFAIHRGKIINKLKGAPNIELIHRDLYQAQLQDFDYIYLYLLPDFMAELEDRIFNEIDEKTIIITNTFSFPNHIPFKTIKNAHGKEIIMLYKK